MKTTITNKQNKDFLNSIGDYKVLILTNIASHYGITTDEAYDEVTHDEAENIMEYMNGANSRLIALTLWNKFILSNNN